MERAAPLSLMPASQQSGATLGAGEALTLRARSATVLRVEDEAGKVVW